MERLSLRSKNKEMPLGKFQLWLSLPKEPSIVNIIEQIFSYYVRMTQLKFLKNSDKCKGND